ncbi:hypothetical protein [Streptomyces lichenis]|uniref:Tip attachment protein J domain-containing protein n=1 Tax=Streptomyces lichenis TaxID=2306967 RepID=A0ABT0IG65_9ACTN|nr:hypothetical protein [Streptomyces lichenis]MCK8680315.1 hypothetical protein [Streptomyces lichenis]
MADEKLTDSLRTGARLTDQTVRLGGRDVTEQVQSWQLERSYSTDLPDAMRAFAGSASAQLQLQVSGADGRSAPALYSPWAPRATGDLARPGQSVVQGYGTEAGVLPAFRGTVRNRSAASGTDTVQITALDGAERLRGPAELPKPYAGFYWRRPVATATWCVDELLRQAGLHSAPPPRYPEFQAAAPLTLVHASLHGGFAAGYGQPEVVPDPRHYRWSREGAPHEMALVPHAAAPDTAALTATWFPRSRVTVPGSRLFAEAWVNSAVGFGSTAALEVDLNRTGTQTGRLRLAVDFAAGKVIMHSGTREGTGWFFSWGVSALTRKPGVWHIGGFFDTVSAGSSVLPTVQPFLTAPDGVHYPCTPATFADASAAQPAAELYQLRLVTQLAAESVQLSSGLAAAPTASEFAQTGAWTKEVVLDDAILPLYALPRVSGSQWEVITQIAKASMSTAELDERGVFRWRNHTRFEKTPTAADLTLTSVRDIAALTVTEEIDACRNYCVQPYRDWSKVAVVSGTTYHDTAVREIPPAGSVTLKYVLAEEEFDVGPPNVDDDQSVAPGFSVRFAASNAAGAPAVKGEVDILARREEGVLILRLTNRGSRRLYTVSEDGRPSVFIQTLKPSTEAAEREATSYSSGSASERFYGRQEFSAEASDWVQDYPAAQDLADAMRQAGQYPVPVLGEVEVLYDPRIQLGDVVRVVDTSGAALDTLAWVVGIKTASTAPGTVQQTLTLRGTRSNGLPQDAGLTPDTASDRDPLPAGPDYAAVAAAYPTLGDLAADWRTWRRVKEGT